MQKTTPTTSLLSPDKIELAQCDLFSIQFPCYNATFFFLIPESLESLISFDKTDPHPTRYLVSLGPVAGNIY